MRAVLTLAVALAAIAVGVLAQPQLAGIRTVNQTIDEVLGDHAPYERVILAVQRAVKAHDAPAVAALVRYPIKVTVNGRKRLIRSRSTFIAHYDAIVTPAIAAAVSADRYEDVMVNQQGVMFGQGEIWIGGRCLDAACKRVDVKIITIQPRSPLSPPGK